MRFVDLVALAGLFAGLVGGILLGLRHFGVIGGIVGALAGGYLGLTIGRVPDFLIDEWMFREMQKSSNDELRAKLERPGWDFIHTTALLNLQARGEDVESYRPRILTLLEADDSLKRLLARDALRWVFTPLAVKLEEFGYDPNASTSACRDKVAQLRESLGSIA